MRRPPPGRRLAELTGAAGELEGRTCCAIRGGDEVNPVGKQGEARGGEKVGEE
jgi:hypothetical protein